jgi:hypothetical protein
LKKKYLQSPPVGQCSIDYDSISIVTSNSDNTSLHFGTQIVDNNTYFNDSTQLTIARANNANDVTDVVHNGDSAFDNGGQMLDNIMYMTHCDQDPETRTVSKPGNSVDNSCTLSHVASEMFDNALYESNGTIHQVTASSDASSRFADRVNRCVDFGKDGSCQQTQGVMNNEPCSEYKETPQEEHIYMNRAGLLKSSGNETGLDNNAAISSNKCEASGRNQQSATATDLVKQANHVCDQIIATGVCDAEFELKVLAKPTQCRDARDQANYYEETCVSTFAP